MGQTAPILLAVTFPPHCFEILATKLGPLPQAHFCASFESHLKGGPQTDGRWATVSFSTGSSTKFFSVLVTYRRFRYTSIEFCKLACGASSSPHEAMHNNNSSDAFLLGGDVTSTFALITTRYPLTLLSTCILTMPEENKKVVPDPPCCQIQCCRGYFNDSCICTGLGRIGFSLLDENRR